jgi:hypothetical protein
MNQPSLVIFFSPAFVRQHPQAYCAWRSDYQHALRSWMDDPTDAYPKLVKAGYLTPFSAKAGPDGGRDPKGEMSLSEFTATMEDMVKVGFLPKAMLQPAGKLVLSGYALVRQ